MEAPPPTFYFSFGRLWTIGRNTMTEIIRQKFFYILVLFAIVVLVSAKYISGFSSVDPIKFNKDFGLATMMVFGTLIAIVGTAQLLPLELENRTIYPILAKPVFRAEFLLGKFVGMIALLLLTIILMSLIFAGLLLVTEHQLVQETLSGGAASQAGVNITPQEAVQQIYKQVHDRNLLKAIGLIYVKVVVVSAITLMISTFATSVIFTVIASFMFYICGHLESAARLAWQADQAFLSKAMLLVITFFVPDLNGFNVADDIVIGKHVPMAFIQKTACYGFFYAAVVLFIAYIIFQEKEI